MFYFYTLFVMSCDCGFNCVFFFKQKTAYELRISDWSSDVCSSDLVALLEVVVDQVGDDLGVGLRFELVAQRGQSFTLLFVVLDDAVVHQRHAVADVRMRVEFRHATMRGPAGVADAQVGMEALGAGGRLHRSEEQPSALQYLML